MGKKKKEKSEVRYYELVTNYDRQPVCYDCQREQDALRKKELDDQTKESNWDSFFQAAGITLLIIGISTVTAAIVSKK